MHVLKSVNCSMLIAIQLLEVEHLLLNVTRFFCIEVRMVFPANRLFYKTLLILIGYIKLLIEIASIGLQIIIMNLQPVMINMVY